MELSKLLRPNIASLAPYSCARNEFHGKQARIYLDANENPFNVPFNRYPDPLQLQLKSSLSKLKGVPAANIFLGNGSDEAIDLVYRCFCRPGVDNVVAIEPTYGMYRVCADINDVEYRPVLLDERFQLNADRLLAATDAATKAVWLCSPNNPTGNSLLHDEVMRVIASFQGIVVVDEAYIDFSAEASLTRLLATQPNLVVLQTMSKAWGCAAIRLGMAFASREIIDVFNKVKYPYNVSLPTQQAALEQLQDPFQTDKWVRQLLAERQQLMQAFGELPITEKVFPSDANFFLTRVRGAQHVYDYLTDQGIVVRNRSRVTLCGECLRITVGTRSENTELIGALRRLG
ncbi:MAG: histidinol-phosphate transaminase [Prevotella sp.]|nr:histidinol-phosphate transaminase [Prevotella sp.]